MSQRLAMFDKLIANGSTDPFVYYGRAMELRSLGRSDEALEAFAALRDRFADYVPTYLMAGQLAIASGQLELARAFLEQGQIMARAAGDDHALAELTSTLAGIA
jgi:tetratricopeptide (TPR) repeat protein